MESHSPSRAWDQGKGPRPANGTFNHSTHNRRRAPREQCNSPCLLGPNLFTASPMVRINPLINLIPGRPCCIQFTDSDPGHVRQA